MNQISTSIDNLPNPQTDSDPEFTEAVRQHDIALAELLPLFAETQARNRLHTRRSARSPSVEMVETVSDSATTIPTAPSSHTPTIASMPLAMVSKPSSTIAAVDPQHGVGPSSLLLMEKNIWPTRVYGSKKIKDVDEWLRHVKPGRGMLERVVNRGFMICGKSAQHAGSCLLAVIIHLHRKQVFPGTVFVTPAGSSVKRFPNGLAAFFGFSRVYQM
jgi:hypothetical protein